jgi:hypothetical protein
MHPTKHHRSRLDWTKFTRQAAVCCGRPLTARHVACEPSVADEPEWRHACLRSLFHRMGKLR